MKPGAARIDYRTEWLIAESAARVPVTGVLREMRQSYAIEDRDVVELGSGIGTNLQVFVPGNRVRGVEGMAEAVAEAQRRGIATAQADLDGPLDLPDASADWVLCIDVLEHLQRPATCLDQARRILRADGRLVINVPNHFDWRGRLRIALGSGIDSQRYFPDSPHWEYPHLRFFQRASIEALLRSCGFAVETDYSGRNCTLPRSRQLARLGLGPALAWLALRRPDLFSAGFFLVCRKADGAAGIQSGPGAASGAASGG